MSLPPASWDQAITVRNTSRVFACTGDSYIAAGSVGGVSFSDYLRTLLVTPIISVGVGGTTITDQIGQVQSAPWLAGRKWVWWDGSPNSYGSVSAYLANLDLLIAACGGVSGFAGLCPLAMGPAPGSVSLSDMQAVYAGMLARGVKTFDVQSYLVSINQAGDSASTAAGLVGPLNTQDGTHLISTVMTSVVAQFKAQVIDPNGW